MQISGGASNWIPDFRNVGNGNGYHRCSLDVNCEGLLSTTKRSKLNLFYQKKKFHLEDEGAKQLPSIV